MSQTSTERLRDYLAQLPPQSQALLMREFERAIERGEDVVVANFVLEQLRKVVRGTEEDDEARPRTDDPARLLYGPLEPFLVESNFPVRAGQIRRASLLPIWQWLGRDGAPEAARAFETALAEIRQSGSNAGLEGATRKFQLAAADAIIKIATPVPGDDRQRSLARIGPPNVVEDLLSIAGVLRARETLDTLGSRMPGQMRVFSEAQIASVGSALNVPSLQTPQLIPFALSLIMQRLAQPWQIIRLAIKMAASDDEIRVAATPYGIAVTIALHDLSFLTACLRTDIRRSHFDNVGEQLKILHDGVRGLRTQGARLSPDAGPGGDPLLRNPVRPRLCLADEPGGRKCHDRRAQSDQGELGSNPRRPGLLGDSRPDVFCRNCQLPGLPPVV